MNVWISAGGESHEFVGVPVTKHVGRRGEKKRDHRTGAATNKVSDCH